MAKRSPLQKSVFKQFGVSSNKPLSKATNPELHRVLSPLERSEFPLNRFGDLSRLPIEHWRSWIDFKAIEHMWRYHPSAEVRAAVLDALRWRSIKAYEQEWARQNSGDIRKNIETPASGLPREANVANAVPAVREIRKRLASLESGEVLRVMDLGCGGGGTIFPIIEMLSLDERKRVEVHLVDVMKQGLQFTSKKLKKMGVRVKTYHTNLYDLSYQALGREMPPRDFNLLKLLPNFVLKKRAQSLRGKIDVVVSGAAIHHAADLEPVFEGISRLTKKDGVAFIFDWGHSRTILPNFYLDDPTLSRPFSRTAKNSPSHLDTIKSMTEAWLGLWGYGSGAKEMLAKRFAKGGRFDFIRWLDENQAELALYKEKNEKKTFLPWCMEGHRNPDVYVRLLKKHGFGEVSARFPFSKPGKVGAGNLLFLIEARKRG